MHDLAEVARVDVAPGVALAHHRIGEEGLELAVLVRLDDVADAQGVDVGAVAHGEGARGLLVADLGQAVAVHRIDVVVLFEREAVKVLVALGEADAVGRLARGDDDLAHAELHRRLDHVVGADDVGGEGGVVRLDQHARDRREMHDGVGRARRVAEIEALEAEMRRQRVEGLAAVGEIGDQSVDAGQVERLPIDVEDVMALDDEMGDGVPPGLAGPAGEDDAHGRKAPCSCVVDAGRTISHRRARVAPSAPVHARGCAARYAASSRAPSTAV